MLACGLIQIRETVIIVKEYVMFGFKWKRVNCNKQFLSRRKETLEELGHVNDKAVTENGDGACACVCVCNTYIEKSIQMKQMKQ